jgi:hypothetical protein
MQLRTEEKFAFLQLAQYIAKQDGEYGLKEREVVDEYCTEMGIENLESSLEHFNLEETLAVFKTSKSQKIATLALMVLVHIDDKYGIYEHKIMHKIAQTFHLNDETMQLFSMWGKSGSALYEQALILTSK